MIARLGLTKVFRRRLVASILTEEVIKTLN